MRSIDDIVDQGTIENRLYQIAAQDKTTITKDDRRIILEAVAELDRLREIVRTHIRAAGAWSSLRVIDRLDSPGSPLSIGPRFGVTAHIRASIIRDAPALARELIAETAGNQFVRCIRSLGDAGLAPYLEAEEKANRDAAEREKEANNAPPG